MKNFKIKNRSALITILLTMTIAMPLMTIPLATAHDPPWTIVSYAYIIAAPDPVGVSQQVNIVMWVDVPLPGSAVPNDIRRHDYKLTITAPDETQEVKTWAVVEDTTSIQYLGYTPTQVGTYTLLFEYPEQTYTWSGAYQNDVFTEASATTTFVVQEEQLSTARVSYPLPAEYWTRPIEGQNTDWWTQGANWLGPPYILTGETSTGGAGYARYQPYGNGPNSPHVMWTRPIQDGGVVGGGDIGVEGNTFYMGGSYNTRFSNALVMYGRLFYELPYGNSGSGGGWICVDIRTGEEIWYNADIGASGTGLSDPAFGYYYAYDDGNQHGILPNGLLFTRSFANAYEPTTGLPTTTNISGVPSGVSVAGPKGETITYTLNNVGTRTNPEYRLTQWNSSNINYVSTGQIGAANWYPGTIDASEDRFFDWNVSMSRLGAGSWTIWREASFNDKILLMQGSLGSHVGVFGGTPGDDQGANVTAVSVKEGSEGQILWTKHYPVAPGNVSREIIAWDPELDVFVMEDKETMVHYGYSLSNGNLLWTNTDPVHPYDTLRAVARAAYGKLYTAGFGGILYCYDMANGNLLWTYGNGGEGNSTYAGLETAWGHYPIFVDVIADGKVYVGTTEHSPGSPYYKDAQYRCINATSGEEIWTMTGWGTGMYVGQYDVVADGFFVYLNCYDMQIYCVGKGPSKLTVTAPQTSIELGRSLIISGTITDIAAGTNQDEQAARFPNGVPCVSDQSQANWMEYVYMQKPRPTDTTGVPIELSVIDSNGNYRTIGTVTSDSEGFYSYKYTPDIEGEYTVYATFAGSESYWPSHAVSAFAVDPASTTPSPQATQPPSMADQYFLPMSAAIIVLIIVVLAVMLVLRKRP